MKNEMPEASHFCILGKYVSYKTEWMRCKKPPRKKSTKLLETMEIHHILLYNTMDNKLVQEDRNIYEKETHVSRIY